MPILRFSSSANDRAVSPYSRAVLLDVLTASGNPDALVTSVTRTPEELARIMFDNIGARGVEQQRRLYGPMGDRVIGVYEEGRARGLSGQDIKAAMVAKILELGPYNVSHHCGDPSVLCVVDLAPTSLRNPTAFARACVAELGKRISKLEKPPDDPAFHLEIPQPVVRS